MNITVLLGGSSSERLVSLATGRAIADALRSRGHVITLVDPALGARGEITAETLLSLVVGDAPPTDADLAKLSPVQYFDALRLPAVTKSDCVFIALHGRYGEDGLVQAMLEMLGVRYTGAGVLASALAMNKMMTKRILAHEGIATPEWSFFSQREVHENVKHCVRLLDHIGLPCVVKPNAEGSSVGLTIVREMSDSRVEEALLLAAKYSDVLVEDFIEGRELTVAIIGNETLPIVEICPKSGYYDYLHKYTKGMTEYFCPATLPEDLAEGVSRDARRAYDAIGCRGYARIDFRLDEFGQASCLEINTLPGMTSTSLVPKAATAAGISFEELCERIVKLAVV